MEIAAEKLIVLFTELDSEKNWGLTPRESTKIFLQDADTHLRKHTIEDYTFQAQIMLEGAAFQKMGHNYSFEVLSDEKLEQIHKILGENFFAQLAPDIVKFSSDNK